MGTFFAILAGLLILTILVVIHELGHAIVARRNGVTVEEFGVGFPPRAKAWKKKKSFLGKNVEYSVNWLPIGGFVKLQGEHDEDGGKEGDFGRASFWAKTKIMFAGVAINWLAAIVLLTILSLFGIPQLVENQYYVESDAVITSSPAIVGSVIEGLPADEAGLQEGDVIDGIQLEVACPVAVGVECDVPSASTTSEIITLTKENPGETFLVQYSRDGEEKSAMLHNRTADEAKDGKGYIGVSFESTSPTVVRSTWSAPIVGVGLTAQLSWETFKGIGGMAGNFFGGLFEKLNPDEAAQQQANEKIAAAGENVAGPVGLIGVILPNLIQAGPTYIVMITAVISLSLAVLNSLPIPGLDGGRWALIAVYRALRRPLTKEREEQIVGYGMLFLLGLFVLITVADIGKFFN